MPKKPAKPVEVTDFPAVTPHLVCRGAEAAMKFYASAFGAKELVMLKSPDGKFMHGSVELLGAMIMLADETAAHGMFSPQHLGATPVTIHLRVDDAKAAAAKAVKAGAKEIMPVTLQFWGDEYGVVEDPFGHRWSIATPGKDAPRTNELLAQAAKKVM